MSNNPGDSSLTPNTTTSVEAVAASREQAVPAAAAKPEPVSAAPAPSGYKLGPAAGKLPLSGYQRQKTEPLYRPLQIFTMDPATPKLDGAVAIVNVNYEPLAPGPSGQLLEVSNCDADGKIISRQADLEQPYLLLSNGYTPSQSEPRFHQQMLYAVCSNVYAVFQKALGRPLSWGFDHSHKLLLKPHCFEGANAYYDPEAGAICFGYYRAADRITNNRSLPGGIIFTCLSHDVIVHEFSHALLDGLRQHFLEPSGPDVLAFHEAFADLIAIFQHFSYAEVLFTAIQRCRGRLRQAQLLTDLAGQFGFTTQLNGPLRSAIETEQNQPAQYDSSLENHQLGSVLVNAVFAAFMTVFERKTDIYFRLASQGTGILPPGELPHDLVSILAKTASNLASHFLQILIRAIDYCPPVGISFGDYLRALITADYDVAPDDPWDYRGAFIDAFWQRNIYPTHTVSLTEDAVLWRCPRIALPKAEGLDFPHLRFSEDPGQVANQKELLRQAHILGRYATDPKHLEEFGLVAPDDPRLNGDKVELPVVQSIRPARRTGPAGQIVFDLIAEITQARQVEPTAQHPGFCYHGGATVILGPTGEVRYSILKNVVGEGRLERRRAFFTSSAGQSYWQLDPASNCYQAKKQLFCRLHGQEPR